MFSQQSGEDKHNDFMLIEDVRDKITPKVVQAVYKIGMFYNLSLKNYIEDQENITSRKGLNKLHSSFMTKYIVV